MPENLKNGGILKKLLVILAIIALLLFSGCTQQKTTQPENNSHTDSNQPVPGPELIPEPETEPSPVKIEPEPESEQDNNSQVQAPPPTPVNYVVSRVIDGDTIELNNGETVRLICIDTPETDESGFQEAKNYLTTLVLGKTVRLEKDVSEIDRYGRLLRYVYLEGLFVNGELVKKGYAEAYRYPPDVALCDAIEGYEAIAKAQKIGIWTVQEPPSSPINPPSSGQYICSSNHYNCSDFTTQSQAQAVYNACGGKNNDIHKLDADLDGEACESLP